MTKLALTQIQPWSPHSTTAPVMRQEGQVLTTQANGTRTCIGGWQLTFSGASTAQSYRIAIEVKADQIDNLRDTLRCTAYWGDFPPDEINMGHPDVVAWDYLLPEIRRPTDFAIPMMSDTSNRWHITHPSLYFSLVPNGIC